MNAQGVVAKDSQENLALALGSGQLSDALTKQGQAILDRLKDPLRLSILGAPGSGKSTLMNLLLGTNVIPEGVRLPTLSLTYGEQPTAKCVLPNGEKKVLAGADPYAIASLKPAFVELALPLPSLRKLSMMEVVTGEDMNDQARAINWASKRTDIALWSTVTCD